MTNEAGATPGLIVHSPGRPAAGLWPFGKLGGTGFSLMALGFPISGIAAAVVGQTSRSARVLQDPLFAQRNQPYPRTKRTTWTSAAGLEESCPTNNAACSKWKNE